MTNIPLNANVQCSDGPCGRSTSAIIHATTFQMTHIVVADTRIQSDPTRLVPITYITNATPDGITLSCTQDDLAALKPFVTSPPQTDKKDSTGPIQEEHIPEGEVDIHSGTDIHATDGRVGALDEFVVDLSSGNITHLIVKEGHLWRKKALAVPVTAIDTVAGDTVYLNLDKVAVEALPPM